MENVCDNKIVSENELYITLEAKEFLREVGKWAKFLSILGFIGIGCMVIFSFSVGAIMSIVNTYNNIGVSQLSGWIVTIIYLGMAILYAFPVYYLYQFSDNLKKALEINNTAFLTKSFKFLKSHYKLISILLIVLMGLYVLSFIITLFLGLITTITS